MSRLGWAVVLGLLVVVGSAPRARAQARPYIGYVYPAGGQQGTIARVQLGGQGLDDVTDVTVTGTGAHPRVVECRRRLNNQEIQLMREQLRELRNADPARNPTEAETKLLGGLSEPARAALVRKIDDRLAAFVQTPASAALASIVVVEVKLDANAPPGPREVRLIGARGVSNPLVFHVGQFPEFSRKAMRTATIQTLGKEELALRRRPTEEVDQQVELPCTLNGQIASREVNRYRFTARKGERLVFSTAARQLIPYIADAVPGWFQPVLRLTDADGKELAYNDDYRFRPDPVLLFEAPKDGEYSLAIHDALYRGREDFVYRISAGAFPFVTSIFPLGRREGASPRVSMTGWNLEGATLPALPTGTAPGTYELTAQRGGLASNLVRFAVDTLPETTETEPNDASASAQPVEPGSIVNGRIDRVDDRDTFRFVGKAGDRIVAEIQARRLDSPLDSTLTIAGPDGSLLAFNDDHEDAASGVNTHHADSYLRTTLPADGTYTVQVADATRSGGTAHAYRLRIGPPRPDFELRTVPSSLAIRGRSSAAVTVQAVRRDGFDGPIKLSLASPPEGFSAAPVTLGPAQDIVRLNVRSTLSSTDGPVYLHVQGTAQVDGRPVVRQAVPAEDRMQAFLWRHLVPADDFLVTVLAPPSQATQRQPARVAVPKP